MRCDTARPLVSAALDEPLTGDRAHDLEAHLATCPSCRQLAAGSAHVRQRLRLEPVGPVPDIAGRVRQRLVDGTARPRRLHPGWLRAAAIFVLAFAVGVAAVGLGRPPVARAGLAERVVAAQTELTRLSADVRVVERGWHPAVPTRTYQGRLSYATPETLTLTLVDQTDYPTDAWRPNHSVLVVDQTRAWSRGSAPCPRWSQPGCGGEQRAAHVTSREPFSGPGPAPLEVVVPVDSFTLGGPATQLGTREVAGQTAVGVRVTVARIAPLVAALTGHGDWRQLHPTDVAEVWLHERLMVPLAISIAPADSAERRRWAVVNQYDDPPGEPILDVEVVRLVVGDAATAASGAPPPALRPRDGGFSDVASAALAPEPAWLPGGMAPYRDGAMSGGAGVAVRTWTDGRAWVKIRATGSWAGRRLFGDLGAVVKRVPLPGAGVAYLGEGGDRVGLHRDDLDVVVSGSVARDVLLRVAASLGVRGRAAPEAWVGAAGASLDDAAAALPGLLAPHDLAGFDTPGVRIEGTAVTLAYVGAGARGFVLTQEPGDRLGPPLTADVTGVAVGGGAGRWSFARGELEWNQDGLIVRLSTRSLSLVELATFAASLEPVL